MTVIEIVRRLIAELVGISHKLDELKAESKKQTAMLEEILGAVVEEQAADIGLTAGPVEEQP